MAQLLIGGGLRDGNLAWLKSAADRLGISCEAVLVDPDDLPAFEWTLGDGPPTVGGTPLACSSAFIRYDVFSGIAAGSPSATANAGAWYAALSAWCAAAGVFTLNANIDFVTGSKPAMLLQAARFGLSTPRTTITNRKAALEALAGAEAFIAKPVAGGSYICGLDEAISGADWIDGLGPSPAIVQPRLDYPERRIYRIANRFFAFDIGASTLDSRLDRAGAISPIPLEALPNGIVDKLRQLTDHLRCDFCAVDMKTEPSTGGLVFLELNNGPMFAGYDRTCDGAMALEMVRYLADAGA